MAINQTVTIKTSPAKLYEALTSADTFAAATGAPAEIADAEGGAFSCFGGQITGRQLELRPNQRIVQAWRAGAWPEGVFSVVRFELSGAGEETTVAMEHTGFPDGAGAHLEGGWHKMYWEPLRAHLE